MTRLKWLLLALGCLLLPNTARADGIDLPVLIACGVGIFVPLLAFNATIDASGNRLPMRSICPFLNSTLLFTLL